MGYTHSWLRENKTSRHVSMTKRKKLLPIVQNIFSRYEAMLTSAVMGERKQPVGLTLESEDIFFNGIGEDAHEAFYFPWVLDTTSQRYSQRRHHTSEFCKTAHKPYDDPVMEILIVLKHFIPGLAVDSDGFKMKGECPEEGWLKAAKRVRNLYGIVTDLFYWDSDEERDDVPAKPRWCLSAENLRAIKRPVSSFATK